MGKGSSKGIPARSEGQSEIHAVAECDRCHQRRADTRTGGWIKSVLLNGTPVLDSEGNTNISGVTVVSGPVSRSRHRRRGLNPPAPETVLGTEVKYDTPITRTITSANIDRLRLTFGVQALVETTSKGTGIRRKSACWFRYSVTVAG